jgi:hypothetical protein
MSEANCNNRLVRPGVQFNAESKQTMRVVRKHEKFPSDWWCEAVKNSTGLWAYSESYILENCFPNAKGEAQPPAK